VGFFVGKNQRGEHSAARASIRLREHIIWFFKKSQFTQKLNHDKIQK